MIKLNTNQFNKDEQEKLLKQSHEVAWEVSRVRIDTHGRVEIYQSADFISASKQAKYWDNEEYIVTITAIVREIK